MRLYVRNGREKKSQKLRDIENTNGLEEHLSECTNNMGCRVEPNSTRKAKKYNLSGLSDDETYVNMMPKLRIKCHSRSQGFNLCLLAEGAYFISTVAQTGNAFS